ncbi:MAG TPA: GNAT family N-acetyltransferase [Candidatus Limnocylindrales bacterium]
MASVQRVLIQNREITHPDVTMLVRRAEDELLALYPGERFSPVDPNARFVVAYVMGDPVGCGALARFDEKTAEIRRMYVLPAHRRTGVARRILAALTRRALEQSFEQVILETGTRQKAAIELYGSSGFERTEPYGEYIDNPYSVCFFKKL